MTTTTTTSGAADLPEPDFGEGRYLGFALRSDAYSVAQVQALFASHGQAPATPQADSQPALDRTRIREIFMTHGFTVKEGQTDLKQYVYDAADALLRAARAPADSVTAPAGGVVAAHRVMRKRLDGEWVCDGRYWCDGPPSQELVESICADKDRWRVDVAYTAPPAQAADSVGRDADRIEKWSDRIQRAHPKSEPEFWPDALRVKYMADEISDLRAASAPADSVLEDAARESEYRRGYRHGYEQRDAEVRGAMA